ncbi:MAG: MoaD/ThiS family protein [Pseudomonadota bacterium]
MAMTIKVKSYLDVQKTLGNLNAVAVEDNNAATLRRLLDHLILQFGKELADQIFVPDTGEIVDHLMLLVNGRNYRVMPEGLDTSLKDGDEVTLFPPAAGG